MDMRWAQALVSLDLDDEQRVELRKLLRLSLAAVRPARAGFPSDALQTGGTAHALCQSFADGRLVPPQGHLWRGRVPFLDAPTLDALRHEAAEVRLRAANGSKHVLLEGSPLATRVLRSEPFAHFVRTVTDGTTRFVPSSTYYHWYESAAHCVEPHVDTDEFALSMLIVLKHVRPAGAPHRSALFIWPPSSGPVEVPLEEGEGVLFHSGCVVHARSAPGAEEEVTTMSFGLARAEASEVRS